MTDPSRASHSRPILSTTTRHNADSIARSPFASSFRSSFLSQSPLAQESIARDIAATETEDDVCSDAETASDAESEASTIRRVHELGSSYRRPSFIAFGAGRPAIAPQHPDHIEHIPATERAHIIEDEERLLRDNHIMSSRHPNLREEDRPFLQRLYRKLLNTNVPAEVVGHGRQEREEAQEYITPPRETTFLLGNGDGDVHGPESSREENERRNRMWEAAVREGKIKTTWQREAKTLAQYSMPLIITFMLQYSLTVASIFTVGRLGTIQLGAVSLASMTANITGYAIYQGLATSLDTLCSQAYGSGKKQLVGLQLQRMVYFLWVLTIPIGLVWFFSDAILHKIVPEKESADYAGLYLRVLILGAPGYALFESGKRYVQAQGLFTATTYVLLFCAPLNAFMNWLFVWHFGWGFVGAPIAVAITDNLLPLFLFLYVYFVDGRQCWGGFSRRAFTNWGPMVGLALPGLVMVEAEFLAFEILTLASSYFGTTHLAAQSILSTLTAITFQIPFPISIAASTRVANLIGATLSDAAKTAARVAFYAACAVGVLNVTILSSARYRIPQLFTDDPEVVEMVAAVLPICAAFQLYDSIAALCSGLLRGLGKQEIGGYVNLFCYYVIAMPISFGTAFGLGWELDGLWLGVAIALGLVAIIEGIYLKRINWEDAVDEATARNLHG